MKKQTGFTLIELMIVVAIIATVIVIIVESATGHGFGTLCKGGMLFNIDHNGYEQQIFDENGYGISCGEQR